MPEESKEDCCRNQDLKTEAQRTNRFNKNPTFSNLTPCNHLESTKAGDEYKTQEKDDLPCINIILKPVLNSKTEQTDKGVQIVEITALTDNMNYRFINDANTSSKKTENVEPKCLKVQTEVEKNIRDSDTQTTDQLPDQKNSSLGSLKKETPEIGTNERNRSVKFRDNRVTDEVATCKPNLCNDGHPDAQSLPNDTIHIVNVDDLTSIRLSDGQRRKTLEKGVPLPLTDCCDSMETLYKSVNSLDISGESSKFKSHVGKTPIKLSDRIRRDIDKLETGSSVSTQSSAHTANTSNGIWQESVRTCGDTCKDIASQVKMLQTSIANSSTSTRDTSTLPSVLSNNPPIPRIYIDTTETMEWESPTKNESSKVTTGTTASDSRSLTSPDTTPCCSNQNLSIENTFHETKNVTTDEDYSDNGRILACGTTGRKSDLNKKNVEKLVNCTDSRGFWHIDSETLSTFEIDRNPTFVETAYEENTSQSIGHNIPQYSAEKPDSVSSRSNGRNLLTVSDLTRPEFIRMLTEIKEHTCSLEMQLFAMNEALKRKQATRRKVFNSTLKNYDSTRRDHLAEELQNETIETTNEPSSCGSEFYSVEYARLTPEEFNVENSLCNLGCATPDDDDSISLDTDVLSPSVSPQPLIVASSPINCCNEPAVFKAASLSPIQQLKESEVTRSTNPTSSNPSVDRNLGKSTIMMSTSKKSSKPRAVAEADGNRDSKTRDDSPEAVQTPKGEAVGGTPVSSCDLNSSKNSSSGETYDQGGKIEPVSQDNVDPTSPSILKRPKVGWRSGVPQYRAKGGLKSSTLSNSFPEEEPSSYKYSSNLSPKNPQTPNNDAKSAPSRLKKGGAIPRLKVLANRTRNPLQSQEEKKDSNDSACCDAVDNSKGHFAQTIKTEENTPFSVNNFSNFDDSEEEVNSTVYGFNNSVDKYQAERSKDDANGRKRKGANKLVKQNHSSPRNTSDKVQQNCKKNSQTLSSDRNILGKFNQNNSQHKDSKCTIRVTVSLDDTPSNEEVQTI